jgi:hypothetical protein
MIIDKAEVLKTLRVISNFDPTASPYVAVQLPAEGQPLFYRSSNYGFIRSEGLGAGALTYVSLSHLQECLKELNDGNIDMGIESNGGLKISTVDSMFDNYLRVHTVHANQAGLKQHEIGEPKINLQGGIFSGIDVKPFHAAAPPVLAKGRLLIGTNFGVVVWDGSEALASIGLSPREAFLRMATGTMAQELSITERGYWGVKLNGLVMYISGHVSGRPLFDSFDVPGEELAHLPAERLVYALGAAANLCGDNQRVNIDPKKGVDTRDRYGNEAIFSLGTGGWPKFSVFDKTAKTIVDALSQTKEEEAVLYSISSQANPTMRLRRGNFEVNFRTV